LILIILLFFSLIFEVPARVYPKILVVSEVFVREQQDEDVVVLMVMMTGRGRCSQHFHFFLHALTDLTLPQTIAVQLPCCFQRKVFETMADVETEQPEKAAKGTVHAFDPEEFNPLDNAGVEDTSWGEVCRTCCCHSPAVWAGIIFRLFWVAFFLYFFIVGLTYLGDGAQVLTGCTSGALFSDDMNPISGLMVGILATVCLQSSSTTTSIIVSLVGAGAIGVEAAIYMVMGANIGTSVTNTIVAMGQMGDGDQLERAFAGATIHDMFNFLTVAVLLPVEVATNMLYCLTEAMVKNAQTTDGDSRESFIKKIVSPLTAAILIPNKSLVTKVAQGTPCEEFYPTECEDPSNPTKATCSKIGLINCDKEEGVPCPQLFQAGALRNDDELGGFVVFLVGIVMLFICLGGLVYVLQQMLLGASTRIIYKATDINGYVAMVLGCLITMAVQSSSITTSVLTPLVGMGLIRLEQMFPMTLGANIGTT
jgi:solute carrier family 34 (sodium-dependent phosphate cotransporter)